MFCPIALQLYSVRNELQKDFPGTLAQVTEMGYDGVELAGLCGYSPEQVKKMCEEAGLVPISAHVPLAEMSADPEKTMKDYAGMGCRYIAIPYLTEEFRPGAEGYDSFKKEACRLGELANANGMTLLYHNHDFEFAKKDGEYLLDIMYRDIPASLLQTEQDTCWVKASGVDPAAYIRKYSGRAPIVHLKDFYKSGNAGVSYELIGLEGEQQEKKEEGTFELRPLGQGMQDIPSILKASEEAGAKWLVVEQDDPTKGLTPIECSRIRLQYLKSLD